MRYVSCALLCAVCFFGCIGTEDLFVAPKAASEQVAECKKSCDKQRFFGCYRASEHSECYSNCASAAGDKIEAFNGCVASTTCDDECSVSIRPSAPVAAAERASAGAPLADDAPTCKSACASFAADGCAGADQCALACDVADSESRYALTYCLSTRSKCQLSAECTGPRLADPTSDCQRACDQSAFFGCITSADQAACRNLCGSVSASTRENFTACTLKRICQDDSCYRIMNPAGAAGDVAGCQAACDVMLRKQCVTAGAASQCRTACSGASPSAIETFKSCLDCNLGAGGGGFSFPACPAGTCKDAACWNVFSASASR